jgi:hypothetical protein
MSCSPIVANIAKRTPRAALNMHVHVYAHSNIMVYNGIDNIVCATISGNSKVRSNSPIHMMVPTYCNFKEIDGIAVRMGNDHTRLLHTYVYLKKQQQKNDEKHKLVHTINRSPGLDFYVYIHVCIPDSTP